MAPRDVAPLSFRDNTGWYGLTVQPSFDDVLGTVRKPLRIPLPDRSAKWYANGPYRAMLLDISSGADSREAALADYRRSGAAAPESVAGLTQSDAKVFMEDVERQHHARSANEALQYAKDEMEKSDRRTSAEQSQADLASRYGSEKMSPVVEAHHDELREISMPHPMPVPRPAPRPTRLVAPRQKFDSYGVPAGPEMPSYEVNNGLQDADVYQATLSRSQGMTYERARDFVSHPTWSS